MRVLKHPPGVIDFPLSYRALGIGFRCISSPLQGSRFQLEKLLARPLFVVDFLYHSEEGRARLFFHVLVLADGSSDEMLSFVRGRWQRLRRSVVGSDKGFTRIGCSLGGDRVGDRCRSSRGLGVPFITAGISTFCGGPRVDFCSDRVGWSNGIV